MPATLAAPFFEIGPKNYLVGDEVLDLALAADRAAAAHRVQVVFTSPLTELRRVAEATTNLLVCAPHADPILPGRGIADVLPEALVAAGARAVMLNHAERPVSLEVLAATLERARGVGLLTIVCASSVAEIAAVAALQPDVVVAEPTELIGTGVSSDLGYMATSTATVREVSPHTLVLQAAGISGPDDVHRVIAAGADATGTSSALCKAPDRAAMAEAMIAAVRRAFDERNAPIVPPRF